MSTVFTPVVDADAAYGEGDWRPVLGENPRKDSWKLYMIGKPSLEHKLRGVILPSFDFTLALEDQSFGSSVGPCWTDKPQKGAERHFSANAWAVPIVMYPYLAPLKEHWLSPANLRNMIGADTLTPEDSMDAFDDLNRWVRRNKQFNQDKKDFFLKVEKLREDPLVPGKTVRYAALNECRNKDNDWHLALTLFTASAYSYFIEQMRWRHQDETAPRDPNWPTYMLGDPTDPAAALEWHADKLYINANDSQETNVMCFTERREFLDPDQKVRKVSPETLAKRFLLVDPANWNIPTYEEQVEYMMRHFDPAVTADMIRAACSHRCRDEIPHSRPESVMLQGSSKKEGGDEGRSADREARDEGSSSSSAGLAPRSSAPPMPRDEPEEEPVAPAIKFKYWAGKAGGKPSQMTVEELQAVVDSGQHEGFKVNMDGAKDWRDLATCGLVTLPTEVPDIPSDIPEDVPADNAPASVPAVEAAPATPVTGLTIDELRSNLFPDEEAFQALSPEKKSDAEALIQRAWEATDQGTKRDFPPEIVDALMQILD